MKHWNIVDDQGTILVGPFATLEVANWHRAEGFNLYPEEGVNSIRVEEVNSND